MKTTVKNNIEAIKEHLNNLDNDELINVHNQYCQNINDSDNEIFSFDEEFFNTFFTGNPYEAARSASFGDINWSDDYIKFNGYGNLQSINQYNVTEFVYIDEIAEHIFENAHEYDIELEEEETEETEDNKI